MLLKFKEYEQGAQPFLRVTNPSTEEILDETLEISEQVQLGICFIIYFSIALLEEAVNRV